MENRKIENSKIENSKMENSKIENSMIENSKIENNNEKQASKSKTRKETRLTLLFDTSNERISSISGGTTTNGVVVDDLTACVQTARARTRILTLVIYTCSILWTFRTDHAFRSTCRWTSYVILLA